MGRRVRAILAGATVVVMGLAGWAVLGGRTAGAQVGGPRPQSSASVLDAALAPSIPSDPSVFGVAPGGIPWVITHGHVVLGSNGTLQVNVTGLVDPQSGANPVPYIAVSVYCGGTEEATVGPVPFSSRGNARVHAAVSLPPFCPAPAVLLNPATSATNILRAYIGFDGLAP